MFWDTSAVVPLLVDEPLSRSMRALARKSDAIIVWWGTAIECASALGRRERDGALSRDEHDTALELLRTLGDSWTEILASEEVRGHAMRLLRRHPLRAADASQLAAALTWADGRPGRHVFVCLDDRLREAARREGFTIRPEVRR